MKIILIGYSGSQCIVPASKYLTKKYLVGFDITYLNYKGDISGWSAYIAGFLSHLTDENIIFALDDYLIADHIDTKKFYAAMDEMGGDVVCVKLCKSTEEEHNEYPVTTQYCIWNREYLISLLSKISTPWEFEINGSKLFDKKVLLRTCIEYYCNSSISGRWNGINLTGLKKEDIKFLKENNYFPDDKEIVFVNRYSNSRTVVFGGSGFLGTELIGRLIAMGYKNIVAVARNEGELVSLKEKYHQIEIMVGDISDKWVVQKAMRGADEVYLLSALKHVGLAEMEVKSCIKTNIIGCMNIVDESILTKPKLLMFISTDKAALPTGVYGCSKKIGEKLIQEAEKINIDTKYRICRYGNVWKSNGSLITKWMPKMLKGEEIILTDPEASRFFWKVSEAVDLIFECTNKAKDATPFIPKMKAVSMQVVLDACHEVYGKCPVKIIGLQEGENKAETTDGIVFSDSVEQFTKEEFINKFLK